MAIKDMFKNLVNVNEDDLDEGYNEPAVESSNESARQRSQAPVRRAATARPAPVSGAMKVVIVRPETFDEVSGIADHLIQGKTVVLNLETANKEISRRIVDFMCGAAYALACKLKKVANNTFIIVPEHTDIAGEMVLDDFDESNYYL